MPTLLRVYAYGVTMGRLARFFGFEKGPEPVVIELRSALARFEKLAEEADRAAKAAAPPPAEPRPDQVKLAQLEAHLASIAARLTALEERPSRVPPDVLERLSIVERTADSASRTANSTRGYVYSKLPSAKRILEPDEDDEKEEEFDPVKGTMLDPAWRPVL